MIRSAVLPAALLLLVLVPGHDAGALGPFDVLDWADGVTTSRDGHSVFIKISSVTHRAVIAPYTEPAGWPEHGMMLGIDCRAPDAPTVETHGRTYGVPFARAEIFLDNHPDWGGAYSFFHPLYWILELRGTHIEQFPVEVTIGPYPPVRSELRRPLTNYNAPRPGLHIAIPVKMMAAAFAAGGQLDVSVRGEGIHIDGHFDVTDNPVRASTLALQHCMPSGPR